MKIVTPILLPTQLKNEQWYTYLAIAVARETGEPPAHRPYERTLWARRLRELAAQGVDPFVAAISIDLLALDWAHVSTLSPWLVLSPGYALRWSYSYGRPPWFWRAVWFSRYAQTRAEVEYYHEWLEQAEFALETNDGFGDRAEAIIDAKLKLEEAERTAQGRAATFKLHWLAQRREALCLE